MEAPAAFAEKHWERLSTADSIRMTNDVRRYYRRAALWNARWASNRNRHAECADWLLRAQYWHDLIMRDRLAV